MRPRQWWAESAPPGWNRVKVSENLGANAVALVASVECGYIPDLHKYLISISNRFGHVVRDFESEAKTR